MLYAYLYNYSKGVDKALNTDINIFNTFLKKINLFRGNSLQEAKNRINDSSIKANLYKDELPLVSVVIPIYDRTTLLIESIESILNQSYSNIELLLICDGSPKETLDIVDSYINNNKVRVFKYKDNSGTAVRGRNKAIDEAKGVYLAFQDSDDIAESDRIKTSVDCAMKYNADVIYGGWRAIVDDSRITNIKNGQEIFSPECDYEMLKKICVPCQSTVMARIESLRNVGGLNPKMKYREDHELWLRLAYNGYKFKSIDKILTNLRLHSNNLERSFKDNDSYWYNKVLEEYLYIPNIKPKIAYLIPGCGIGGGIAVICEHVNKLKNRGYDVLLITEDNSFSISWFPNQDVRIVKLIDFNESIDILVATGWSTAYIARNINAKRKLYFVQSDESRFYPKGSSNYLRALETYKMDYEFFTEAKWIQKWLKEKFNKDAYYVPNGLNENIFYKTNPLEKKGEKVRVLLEGPICIPYKCMDDAFNVVKDLDCEVWCVSSAGKPKPEWRCDKFFEKVKFEEMKNIYSSCDILLKMSSVEGFFGPPLEMMACGGACVVSNVSGYDEYIIDKYNALVVDIHDINAAKEAVKLLINDKKLRMQISKNGFETSQRWRWDTTIDILEDIFNNIDMK